MLVVGYFGFSYSAHSFTFVVEKIYLNMTGAGAEFDLPNWNAVFVQIWHPTQDILFLEYGM